MACRAQEEYSGNLRQNSGDGGGAGPLLPYQADATRLVQGKPWVGEALGWGYLGVLSHSSARERAWG